jgi:hypothetical protein
VPALDLDIVAGRGGERVVEGIDARPVGPAVRTRGVLEGHPPGQLQGDPLHDAGDGPAAGREGKLPPAFGGSLAASEIEGESRCAGLRRCRSLLLMGTVVALGVWRSKRLRSNPATRPRGGSTSPVYSTSAT